MATAKGLAAGLGIMAYKCAKASEPDLYFRCTTGYAGFHRLITGNWEIRRLLHPYGINVISSASFDVSNPFVMLYGMGPDISLYIFQEGMRLAFVFNSTGALSGFHG